MENTTFLEERHGEKLENYTMSYLNIVATVKAVLTTRFQTRGLIKQDFNVEMKLSTLTPRNNSVL